MKDELLFTVIILLTISAASLLVLFIQILHRLKGKNQVLRDEILDLNLYSRKIREEKTNVSLYFYNTLVNFGSVVDRASYTLEEIDKLEIVLDQIQENYYLIQGARDLIIYCKNTDLDKKLLDRLYSKAQSILSTLKHAQEALINMNRKSNAIDWNDRQEISRQMEIHISMYKKCLKGSLSDFAETTAIYHDEMIECYNENRSR